MSGIIRQQIGIAKRQLRKALQEAEGEHSDPNLVPKFKDDELLAAYEAHTSVHDSLFRTYARVSRLWKQWEELLKQNPEEEEILKQYITKYGDFRLLLNSAVSVRYLVEDGFYFADEVRGRG
ncbi:unnamed protein product [Nippostrongylus brasiliensis]|uniref:PFL domain-containing protein n=1 Tax=Nippostrongylus brasiliensis TaxID=27835 RepID=A0A0N4YN46_NIPBR|nr:unnamed protein product [Nippostrongylus brasiliensis]